jgi:hypothetical protein
MPYTVYVLHWERRPRLSSPGQPGSFPWGATPISRGNETSAMLFGKTIQKVKEATDDSIGQPIRNVGLIALAALITAIIGIILAVRR